MNQKPKIPHIGILIGTSADWGRDIVSGILSYSQQNGPWFIQTRPQQVETDIASFIQETRSDGLIVHITSERMELELQNCGIPYVDVSGNGLSKGSAPCIRTDDEIATRMAAKHFLDRGFHNIALAVPDSSANPRFYARAFHNALKSLNRNCHTLITNEESAAEQDRMREWLISLPKPVGLLTWGVSTGYNAVNCCVEAGIPVPHEVAVLAGRDDELLSRACYPPLSGIMIPTKQIGMTAAATLDNMLHGGTVSNGTVFLSPIGIRDRLSTNTLAVNEPILEQVIAFIREHAFEPITMDDILAEIPMARSSLERKFQKAFGRTPIDEIRRLRINKARSLLIETDKSLQEIAEECGYSTYNYLTRVFKNDTGVSPGSFRTAHRPR